MTNSSAKTDPPKFRYGKSLEISWKEGIPAAVMVSIIDYYVIPLALFLGAAPAEIGFLVAVPHLLGSFSQLLSVRIVKLLGNRLRFLVRGTAVQAALIVPIAVLPFLTIPYRIPLLIAMMSLFRILAHLIGTVWGSLTSDYLPPEQRGRYFGWRAQVAGIASITGVAAGGTALYLLKNVSSQVAFFVLFFVVAAARGISSFLMSKMEDVPLKRTPESDFTFVRFLARFKESNFVKFVFFVSAVTFSTNLAAPYFNVYLLKEQKVDYLFFTIIQISSIIGGLIAFPIWGRHADRFGNAKILKVTSWLIPVIPFLWALAPSPYVIPFIEILAGFIWGGFNLCTVNYVFDAVTSEKRVRCFAYFSLINGISLFFGASLGGYLAENLPAFKGSSLLSLFLLSGLLRFGAHFLLSPHFREVRASASKISSRKLLFSVVGIRPLFGRNTDWNLFTFMRKSAWDSA